MLFGVQISINAVPCMCSVHACALLHVEHTVGPTLLNDVKIGAKTHSIFGIITFKGIFDVTVRHSITYARVRIVLDK